MKRFRTQINDLPVVIWYEYHEIEQEYEIVEVLPVYGANILPMLTDKQYKELQLQASQDRVN